MTELDHLFVVATRAKPAPSAAEGEQILVLTVRTVYFGKALMKIATFKVFLDNMIYNRAVKPIPILEKFVIAFQKFRKMPIQEQP